LTFTIFKTNFLLFDYTSELRRVTRERLLMARTPCKPASKTHGGSRRSRREAAAELQQIAEALAGRKMMGRENLGKIKISQVSDTINVEILSLRKRNQWLDELPASHARD